MDTDLVTLQEAAEILNKSPQTVRRMIKRGELKAQRVKTPQGFHYVVDKTAFGVLSNSPIQNDEEVHVEAVNVDLTNQNEIPTSRNVVEVHTEAKNEAVDIMGPDLLSILEGQHREKMFLISILERLQEELDRERRKPRSLFSHFVDWLLR